jgi:hypothetical protein
LFIFFVVVVVLIRLHKKNHLREIGAVHEWAFLVLCGKGGLFFALWLDHLL